MEAIFITAQEIIDTYTAENRIPYMFGDTLVTLPIMLAVVLGSGVVFMAFSMFWMKRYKKH